jgi:hypothetical protein
VWEIVAVGPVPVSRNGDRVSGHGSRVTGHVFEAPVPTNAPRFDLATQNLVPGRYTISVQSTNGTQTSAWVHASITLVEANLDAVKIYPNPWRSDRHSTHSVTFDNLTVNTQIKIYTVSGHHVKTLPESSSTATWDLTNQSGERVASGIYVYHLKADGGAKKTGQVVVIK